MMDDLAARKALKQRLLEAEHALKDAENAYDQMMAQAEIYKQVINDKRRVIQRIKKRITPEQSRTIFHNR